MKKILVLIIGVLFLIIVLFLYLGYSLINSSKDLNYFSNSDNKENSGNGGVEDSGDNFGDSDSVEDSGFNGEGNGGIGGRTIDGSDSSNSLSNNCEQQIAYAIKDFKKNEICNQFEGDSCIDKSANCSLAAYNLDDIGGVFKIRFVFFEEGESYENGLQTITREISLEPEKSEAVEAVFNFQNSNAEKTIDCIFFTDKIPKKNVC